jgi:BlaI family transcriptional regulator, penicillinase repressor
MKQLTQAEEEVMQVLWRLEAAFVKEIVEEFPEPKPAYNTVSTIIRILEKKGVVGYTAFGNTHQYFPLINKEEYSQKYINRFVEKYFSGSHSQLVSFFAEKEDLSVNDLEKLLKELKSQNND